MLELEEEGDKGVGILPPMAVIKKKTAIGEIKFSARILSPQSVRHPYIQATRAMCQKCGEWGQGLLRWRVESLSSGMGHPFTRSGRKCSLFPYQAMARRMQKIGLYL